MTQHESPAVETGPTTRSTVCCLLFSLLLVAGFAWLQAERLPSDGPLSYDEATHLAEGVEVADLMDQGEPSRLVDHFLKTKVMKGVLYRLWYGAGFTLLAPGADHGRAIGLFAGCLALLVVFFLARALAPPSLANRAGIVALFAALGAPLLHDQLRRAMVEPLNLLTIALALLAFVLDRKRESIATASFAALALLVAVATKYNHALVLLAAIGLDSLLEAWSRRDRPWRHRLRPFLPLLFALLPVFAYLADPTRAKSVWYYIWTIPDGGNPVDLTGSTYAATLASRIAPTTIGNALALVAVALGALAAIKTRLPGGRLVAVHLAIGLALAQANDLKLERILVPLTGSFFALLAVGVAIGSHSLRFTRPALKPISLGFGLLLWALPPSPSLYAIRPDPYRATDAWLDEGIRFTRANPRALWLGGSFGEGRIWNTATIALRAREIGAPLPPGAFMFGGVEFFQKSKLDLSAVKGGGADAELFRLLEPYRSLVVVLDPTTTEPTILNPLIRQVYGRLRASGRYELAEEPRTLVFPTAGIRPLRARFELWVRADRPR